MPILLRGCPTCAGALYVEALTARLSYEGSQIEAKCLACGRPYSVQLRPAGQIDWFAYPPLSERGRSGSDDNTLRALV